MTGNWITDILSAAMAFFNEKISLLFQFLLADPQEYMNGEVWKTASLIFDSLLGSGFSIMAICIYLEIARSSKDILIYKKSENMIWILIMCSVLGSLMYASRYLLMLIFGITKDLALNVLAKTGSDFTLGIAWRVPDYVVNATNGLDTTMGVLVWVLCLIGAVFIVVSSFTILLIAIGRLFNLYIHIAIAPIPIAFSPCKATQTVFANYLKSFLTVCLQALVIIIVCILFSSFAKGGSLTDGLLTQTVQQPSGDLVTDGINGVLNSFQGDKSSQTIVFEYLITQLFLFMFLAGCIKTSDELIRRLFGI